VHVLTASGAALAFGALVAAVSGHWVTMFACLGVALVVDGIDGPLARHLKVGKLLPRWSGDVLDLVVDFLTYVFVPAYAITGGGLLPDVVAVPAGMLIVVSGAIYFADRQMKYADHYFRGFPALWNAVAFYLFVMRLPPALATAAILLLAALSFAPIRFVHPLRVVRLRAVTIAALLAWLALALTALVRDLAPGPWVAGGLVAFGLYFFSLGLLDPVSMDDRTSP
jgi:phosphatidylcholine synthase